MVFKHLTLHFLEKYLGEYLEDLDTKKLKIGLWHGNVTIRNVHLKTNRLVNTSEVNPICFNVEFQDDFNLPIRIKTGYLEQLTIHIPWKHLHVHPTRISVQGFYVLLEPKTDIIYDARKQEEHEYQSKMKQVKKVEKYRLKREKTEYSNTHNKHRQTFFQRLKFHILRNLEVSIENIYIHYQDKYIKPGHPFTFTVILHSIKLTRTNSEWGDVHTKEHSKILYKIGELNHLSISWNSDSQFDGNLSKEDLINYLKADNLQQNYILQPLHASAKLEIARKAEKQHFQQPVLQSEVLFQEINLNITRSQYSGILDLLEYHNYYDLKSKYIKYYTPIGSSQHDKPSRRRWKFAYNVILNEQIRPRLASYQWKNIKLHLDRSKEYYNLYYQQLTNHLPKEHKQSLEELERQMNAFGLIYVRRIAQMKAMKRKLMKKERSQWDKLSDWFNHHRHRHRHHYEELDFSSDTVMLEEEKDKLYEAMEYHDEHNTIAYPPEYVDINLAIRLNLITVNILSNINEQDAQFRVLIGATLSNLDFVYKHRPAANNFSFEVNVDTFQISGNPAETNQVSLIQSHDKVNQLLHIQFATNPVDQNCDYHLFARAKSLDLIYHTKITEKLMEFFLPEKEYHLEKIKEAAYSIYTDIQKNTQFLFSENLKKIKALDLDIDIQPLFVVLLRCDEKSNRVESICLDSGHLTFKGGEKFRQEILQHTTDNRHQNSSSFIPLQFALENTKLVYCEKDWKQVLDENNSSSHIIQPVTFTCDIYKSVCTDRIDEPIWNITSGVSRVISNLSDKRISEIVKVFQSIQLPQTRRPSNNPYKIQKLNSNDKRYKLSVKQLYRAVEDITSATTTVYEEGTQQKQLEPHQQLTEIQLFFQIPSINLYLNQYSTDVSEPLMEIALTSIVTEGKMKTYDIEFDLSLQDVTIIHQQFKTEENKKFSLLSKQHQNKIFTIAGLLTSADNPLFSVASYNSIENQISITMSRFILNIQLEIIQSILMFKNNITKQLALKPSTKTQPEAITIDTKTVQRSNSQSFKIVFNNEEFGILIGNESSQLFYMALKTMQASFCRTRVKMLGHFIIHDFVLLDPSNQCRFDAIVSKEDNQNDLLSLDFSLFNYSENRSPPIDSYVKGRLDKLNIVLLYKHIQLLLTIIQSFNQNISKQKKVSSTKQQSSSSHSRFSKLHFQIELLGPRLFVPKHSYSFEAILIDFGQIALKTASPKDETYALVFKNLSINRVKLNNNNQVIETFHLSECSSLNIFINYCSNVKNIQSEQAMLSIKIQWDQLDFIVAKDDYLFLIQMIKGNFTEKISSGTPAKEQTKGTNEQSNVNNNKVYQLLMIDVLTKRASLTLCKDHMSTPNSKLLCFNLSDLQLDFQLASNATYRGEVHLQTLFADGLCQPNSQNSISRLIDRKFDLEQNAPILSLSASSEQSIIDSRSTSLRRIFSINGEIQSIYIGISVTYLLVLKDYFTINQLAAEEAPYPLETTAHQSKLENIPPPAKHTSSSNPIEQNLSTNADFQTVSNNKHKESSIELNISFTMQPCQLILIEDEKNSHSNCLVAELPVVFKMTSLSGTQKIAGSTKDLLVYASNFDQLRQSGAIKYHILKPCEISLSVAITAAEQIIDVHIGDISVDVNPMLIHVIISTVKSLNKQQATMKQEKEKFDSKTLFDPKPFKDSNFWFIQDSQEKENRLEQTDILEIATGSPLRKKQRVRQQNKKPSTKLIHQQFTADLNIVEVKFQLGTGSTTRPVIALCLSKIYAQFQDWSSNLSVSSSIQIELALFNDHLLAWEPLIEPIVDPRGQIVSPWSIKCHTKHDNEIDEIELETLLNEDKSLTCKAESERLTHFDIQNIVFIRADHLLNVTLTKTSIILAQHLFTMLGDIYKNEYAAIEHDDRSILSIHNQTGYRISIGKFIGIQFIENNHSNEDVYLRDKESIKLTVSADRLSATHLPAISEQIDKRKQEFSVEIEGKTIQIDINQTWRRVYEIDASSMPNWPIQLLCDSQIHEDRRRIVLSSIIKVTNLTIMPLILLDPETVETKKFHRIARIDVNQEFYVPIQFLYLRMSPRLYFTIDTDDSNEVYDFMSFEWAIESSSDRVLKRPDGSQVNYVIHKDSIEAYSENTDEPIRNSFNICVQLALHLINFLPILIQCRIDNSNQIELRPSELCHVPIGNKKSVLVFIIPSYKNTKWISESVDLKNEGDGNHNEHLIIFHDDTPNQILRMILRVEICRHSYRASFYCPYWIVNTTDLQFQIKIEHEKIFIDETDQAHLVCPRKIHGESHKKKAHIRLYDDKEDESISHWSESFSINVIKSTGMTTCKVSNDRIYTICINIETCSFGMSKIITIAPSMFVINNSSIELEIIEMLNGSEQDKWKSLKAEQVIPFWPHQIKDDMLCVRYVHNQEALACIPISNKYRTLLRMNDEEYPAIDVQIHTTDFDGYRIVFSDYKTGDAPILLVNTLIDQSITFSQKGDSQAQVLPSQHYLYYTWNDPFKPYELTISADVESVTVELHPTYGVLDQKIHYAVFHDGPQTVLLFSSDTSIIESVTDTSLVEEPIRNYIQLIVHSIGVSIINDITRDDLLYVTINPSKDIWITKHKYDFEPVPAPLNLHLEENYTTYIKHRYDQHPIRREIREDRYTIDNNLVVSFDENIGEVSDEHGRSVHVIRQKLDALWIGYAWSKSNVIVHARVQHIQADNQLNCTLFPTLVYPIASKTNAITYLSDKPLIELSLFKSQSIRSNTIDIRYFKILIQEFALCADQGFILALFEFFKLNQNPLPPKINMNRDITLLHKPLESFVKADTYKSSSETLIYFDHLHLSPLKIHVSFTMHGSKPDKQLLAEYPLADFLLQILNLAEVQDVTLKLNFYQRQNDRYTIEKLRKEIFKHYEHQFFEQIHVVILGLDVLGNPFGVIRGVAHGVESFFYEPYEGAMAGSKEFILGVRHGTRKLVGSVIGGTAGALSKVTDAASKSLATLTFDKEYKNIRIKRKELDGTTSSHILSSGKHTARDIVTSVKDLVKKPIEGAKEHGHEGFAKGVGKSMIGLVAKPTSGVVDLTSTSFNSLKRAATHEQVIRRIRPPRHIGGDGIVRPSIAHEKLGNFMFDNIDFENSEDYLAHIRCFGQSESYFFATTKRVLLMNETSSSTRVYEITWACYYKQIKNSPQVKFNPSHIEINYRDINKLHMTKYDEVHTKLVPYQIVGEARYIVDRIIEMMRTLQV
ncbi:unnamed protein product [Adineta ricciae]|uniref:Uncharacterized protein n=1 Tax=Adineta ricciae TaxID=249248 RepID=A0A815L4V8_ADIRI|nr:unnamed protein product [Adineta ricciae]